MVKNYFYPGLNKKIYEIKICNSRKNKIND